MRAWQTLAVSDGKGVTKVEQTIARMSTGLAPVDRTPYSLQGTVGR